MGNNPIKLVIFNFRNVNIFLLFSDRNSIEKIGKEIV